LFTFLTYLVLGLLAYAVGMTTSRDGGRSPGLLAIPLIIVFAVFFLGIIVPTLALTVRRLHDAGYSGLFALLLLIPYLGSLIMMIFALCRARRLALATTRGRNFRHPRLPLRRRTLHRVRATSR
jgi:uncharacterized membrane protein YhaH (DUF805 family)